MRTLLLCSAVACLALIGCSRDPKTLTVNDFIGVDSTEAFEVLSKADAAKVAVVKKALARLTQHDSIANNGGLALDALLANQTAWEAYAKPRVELYEKAVEALKKRLKAPSTARIGAFDGINNDSASVEITGTGKATVKGIYNAQNGFGVYLPGTYEAEFVQRDGKWAFRFGDEFGSDYLDFKMN